MTGDDTATIGTVQRLLYLYTRREHGQFAKCLVENTTVLRAFLQNHQEFDPNYNLEHYGQDPSALETLLKDIPEIRVTQWMLSFPDLDLNHVHNIVEHTRFTPLLITALEQALLYDFTIDSVLSLAMEPRLSQQSLHRALLKADVPFVLWHAGGFASQPKHAFMEYLETCVTEENADDFLRQFLSKTDVNAQLTDDEGRVGATLLMAALHEFSYTRDTSKSKIFSKLIYMLLSNPDLDINAANESGWTALFFIANCRSDSLETKLDIIEQLCRHPGLDINHCTNNGSDIIRHFLNQYFRVLEQGVRQQIQVYADYYSHAPRILQQLIKHATLSKAIQSSCLMYFLSHRVFNSLEPKNSKSWFDTYRQRLANASTAIIKHLLSLENVDINAQTEGTGHTALMLAINAPLPVHGMMRNELVTCLLAHPTIDINLYDHDGQSALMHAISQGHTDGVTQILSDPHIDLNMTDRNKKTPLVHALHLDPSPVRTLILGNIASHPNVENLNYQDEAGNTVIHVLLEECCTDTVLKITSNMNDSNACPLLLDLENKNGQTAFDITINMCKTKQGTCNIEDVFKCMLGLRNVNVNTAFQHRRTLLHKCAVEGVASLLDILLGSDNIDLNCQDNSGYTALMYAVDTMRMEDISKFLMNPLCDVKIKNNRNETVFDIVNKSERVDKHVRHLVSVVFTRSTAATGESIISGISLDDQLKFLTHAVQREKTFSPTLKDHLVCQIACIQSDITVHTGGRFGSELSMAEEHRRKLIGLRAYLCEEVTPRDLFSHLIADDILTDDIVEDILQQQTRRRMCEKLLSILPLRGRNAYQSFINALQEEGQSHVADQILNYNPNEESNENNEGTETDVIQKNVDALIGGKEPYAIIPLRFMTSAYPQFSSPLPHQTRPVPMIKSNTKPRKMSDKSPLVKETLYEESEQKQQQVQTTDEGWDTLVKQPNNSVFQTNNVYNPTELFGSQQVTLAESTVTKPATIPARANVVSQGFVPRNPDIEEKTLHSVEAENLDETQLKALLYNPALKLLAQEGSVSTLSLDHADSSK